MTLPTLEQAKEIWQQGIDFRLAKYPFRECDEYIFHTQGVAKAAETIASHTADLKPQKAYILGLLHDYGKKYSERASGKFHGQVGFEEMSAMEFDEVAKTCLTHTFPTQEFEDIYYSSYKPEWLDWARQQLKQVTYDDYDRLIQLCDMFFEGMNMVSFEERIEGIRRRYGLTPKIGTFLQSNAECNKNYFDAKCGCDIYRLLNITPYNAGNKER